MTLTTEPLHPLFGAEIKDCPLENINNSIFQQIMSLFYQHSALLFRGQIFSPATQVELTERFGVPSIPPRVEFNLPDYPEVSVLGNLLNDDGSPAAFFNEMGEEWHSDSAGYENLDGATFLYCVETPSNGGETMLCSMTNAWESLDEKQQQMMYGLQVLHSWNFHNDKVLELSKATPLSPEQRARMPDHWTELVQKHPVTGKSLYYLSHNLVKQVDVWSEKKSIDFVMPLVEHATRPSQVYTHKWQPGDLLIWDNRSTMHSATNVEVYRDEIRHMRRSYAFMGANALPEGKLAR